MTKTEHNSRRLQLHVQRQVVVLLIAIWQVDGPKDVEKLCGLHIHYKAWHIVAKRSLPAATLTNVTYVPMVNVVTTISTLIIQL